MLTFGTRMINVTTSELEARLKNGEQLTVIDVREPWEYAEGHVPGSLLRPLGQIRTWISQFSRQQELFLICRTASRSAAAYQFMQAMGFTQVRNVSGGIITWRGPVAR